MVYSLDVFRNFLTSWGEDLWRGQGYLAFIYLFQQCVQISRISTAIEIVNFQKFTLFAVNELISPNLLLCQTRLNTKKYFY